MRPNGNHAISPAYLSASARVELLHEIGLGRGWVLLTMSEMNTIRDNTAAYKVERAELLACAHAYRDAQALPFGVEKADAMERAGKMPIPPKPKPQAPSAPPPTEEPKP